MKKHYCICFLQLLTIHLIFSTGFAKNSNGDLIIESNGLSLNDAYLSSYGQRFSSNQLQFQTKVKLNLDGIRGYAIKDDKVFIGCSMQVIDKYGKALLNETDLFPGDDGLERNTAGNLYLNLVVGTPMRLGASYTWIVKVWDKVGHGEVRIELKFKVIETSDKVGIDVNARGLKARSVFVTNQNGAIQSNKVSYLERIKLNFYDLKGFTKKAGKVFVGGSMIVSDSQGNTVLEYSDLFADYDQTGVEPAAAEKLHLLLTVGDPLKKGEIYTWKSKVWDKAGKGEITSEVKIEVVN